MVFDIDTDNFAIRTSKSPISCRLKRFLNQNKHEEGTKIKGLILGIAAAVLILIGVSMYFYQRRKSRNQVEQTVNT